MEGFDDIFYDIPSVPKFVDFGRVDPNRRTSLDDTNSSLGDAFFDLSGIIVGGMPCKPHYEPIVQIRIIKETESIASEMKGDKQHETKSNDESDSSFGIKKMAMFRRQQPTRRAVSVERVDGIAEKGTVKQRSISNDPSKRRSNLVQINKDVKLPKNTTRRSVPLPLREVSNTHQQQNGKEPPNVNSIIAKPKPRPKQPMMGVSRKTSAEHRQQLATPSSCDGPETKPPSKTKLAKRSSTPPSVLKAGQERRVLRENDLKSEQFKFGTKIPLRTSNKHGKAKGVESLIGVSMNKQNPSSNTDIVIKNMANTMQKGEHKPRERTRRNIISTQKAPVRMQKIPLTKPPMSMSDFATQCPFERPPEQSQHSEVGPLSQTGSNKPHQSLISEKTKQAREQHSVICQNNNPSAPQSATVDKPSKELLEKELLKRTVQKGHDADTQQKDDHVSGRNEQRPIKCTYRRRSSTRLTETERNALFNRLSTPKSIILKRMPNNINNADGTPRKAGTNGTVVGRSNQRRSGFPIMAHPSTYGLREVVHRVRSNSGSRKQSSKQTEHST